MPVPTTRRKFLRGGLGIALSFTAAACGQNAQPNAALPPTAEPTIPAAYPSPELPAAYPSPNAAAYPSPAPQSAAYPPPTVVASPVATTTQFQGVRALEHATAQVQWIPRSTGTPGWQACGDYIETQFAAAGWEVENQRFDYQNVSCRNIIARRGSGGKPIIIGAHYDARIRADNDPDPARQNDPVPAANDGASGVAVLLELARVLDPDALGHEIWLAAFDAEDNGDLDGWDWIAGSRFMANSLEDRPAAVIVADMVGDASQQLYYEQTSDQPLREAIWAVAGELGYASFVPQVKFAVLDDHTPFLERGFKAIDIIDFEYSYWHTTQDTIDKVSAESLEAVGKTLEAWLLRGAPGIE